jgi:hypothetical protein
MARRDTKGLPTVLFSTLRLACRRLVSCLSAFRLGEWAEMSASGSLIRWQRGPRLDHRRAGRQSIGRGILVAFVLIIALSFTMLARLLTAMVTVFRCSRALT